MFTLREIFTPPTPRLFIYLFIYFPSSECPSKGKYSRDLMPHFIHIFRYLTFHIWTSTRIKKSSSVAFNNIWQPSMSLCLWPTVGTVGRGLQRLRYTITPEPAQLRSVRCSWKLQKAPDRIFKPSLFFFHILSQRLKMIVVLKLCLTFFAGFKVICVKKNVNHFTLRSPAFIYTTAQPFFFSCFFVKASGACKLRTRCLSGLPKQRESSVSC